LITSREQYYVDTLDPYYNIQKEDVTSGRGVKRNKISENIIDSRRKKIDVYNRIDLSFIETIIGVRKCSLKYNIDASYISSICLHGITSQYQGDFIFCEHNKDINNSVRDRKTPKDYKRKNTISILQTDEYGKFIKEWRTGSDAEKELGLYKGSVSRVVSGEYKQTKNYYFKPKN